MTETAEPGTPVYFESQGRFRGFTGNGLKLFAMGIMLIDHVAYALLPNSAPSLYWPMRIIGRLAFPIFAYMIAVGARHTHNILKYLLRLLVFAVLSEIPFDMAFGFAGGGQIVELKHQNVFLTLFLGLLALAALRFFQKNLPRFYMIPAVAVLLLTMGAAEFLNTDYGGVGVLCIFLFYMGADKKTAKAPLFALAIFVLSFDRILLINTVELYALISLIPILLHNGQKGAKMNRWIFYAFYPGHLTALWLIRLLLQR